MTLNKSPLIGIGLAIQIIWAVACAAIIEYSVAGAFILCGIGYAMMAKIAGFETNSTRTKQILWEMFVEPRRD